MSGGGWVIESSEDKRGSATFSPCGKYRMSLSRSFASMSLPEIELYARRFGPSPIRWLNMLMLNPSKARAVISDPTVTRQGRRALLLGCDGLVVTNAFAFMATDPKDMKRQADPVGPENDIFILQEAKKAIDSGGLVVAAWGANGGHMGRSDRVREMLRGAGVPLHYLRLTKGGHPEHPLYIGYDVQPKPWE